MSLKMYLGAVAGMVCMVAVMSAQQGAPPVQVRGTTIMPKVACATMSGRTIAANRIGIPSGGAAITSATLKPGTGTDIAVPADYIPEYCEINARIAPADPSAPPLIFQVNIPTRWNQMAFQFGVDGADGHVPALVTIPRAAFVPPLGYNYPPDRPYPVAMGYATFAGDGGHQTPGGGGGGPIPGQTSYVEGKETPLPKNLDGSPQGAAPTGPNPTANAWMKNDESFLAYAHTHVKKTHDAALSIMQDMYGVPSRFMYFLGESNGGRASLSALSRYGADYDGIFAGVPVVYFSSYHISQAQMREVQRRPGGWIPPAKTAAIRNETVRICDSLDGYADGIIYNYIECMRKLNPTITPDPLAKIRCPGGTDTGNDCLSDAQMASVNAFHSPVKLGFPMMNGESDYPMWTVGAEGVRGWLVTPINPATLPPGGTQAVLEARVPGWDAAKIGAWDDATRVAIQKLSSQIDPHEDWSPFLKRNGKLLMYGAGSDYQVNGPIGPMRLFEQARKKNDKDAFDKNVRFYVAPNAGHGGWGISATTGERIPYHTDFIAALIDWVEKGVTPPDALQQTLQDLKPPYPSAVSRPLCRYPTYPKYSGKGDPKTKESWICTAPAPGPSPVAPSTPVTSSAR